MTLLSCVKQTGEKKNNLLFVMNQDEFVTKFLILCFGLTGAHPGDLFYLWENKNGWDADRQAPPIPE